MSQAWSLEADEVVGLPIDELAYLVLQDAKANDEWNYRNWLLLAKTAYAARPDALRALAEAWNWLIARGLVAQNPQQSAAEAFFITRRGSEVLSQGLAWVKAVHRLDVQLMPILEVRVRPLFLRGDFETAVFVAMKQVEIEVRRLTGLPDEDLGTSLMRLAFKADGGPLAVDGEHIAEAEARSHLYAGAIGLFKNPSSHRDVDYSDPTLAAEAVLLADLLLRLLPQRD
jgi:uncharacterized protein (TIGR02391 family)